MGPAFRRVFVALLLGCACLLCLASLVVDSPVLRFGGARAFVINKARLTFDPLWLRPTLQAWFAWVSLALWGGLGSLAAGWAWARARERAGSWRLACLVGAALGSLAATELALHGVVRALGPDRVSQDAAFVRGLDGWVPHALRDNSPYAWDLDYVFRRDDPDDVCNPANRVKPRGQLRIVCMGDSWTQGADLGVADTWPHQLELMLRARWGPWVRVLNAGRGGMGYHQGYLMLTQVVLPLQPDVVIFGGMHGTTGVARYEGYRHLPAPQRAWRWLRSSSYLACAAGSLLEPQPPASEPTQGTVDYLRRSIALLQQRQIYGVHFFHMSRSGLARDVGEVVLGQPLQTFLEADDAQWDDAVHLLVNERGRHPTASGQREIARWLVERLCAWGALQATLGSR